MEKLTDYEQIKISFERALKLIKEDKIREANEVIYVQLNSNLYDKSVDLIDNQSSEKQLIELSKLCKQVYLLLESENDDTIKELTDEEEKQAELIRLSIINAVIEEKRLELDKADFEDWLTEFHRTDDEHFSDIV